MSVAGISGTVLALWGILAPDAVGWRAALAVTVGAIAVLVDVVICAVFPGGE